MRDSELVATPFDGIAAARAGFQRPFGRELLVHLFSCCSSSLVRFMPDAPLQRVRQEERESLTVTGLYKMGRNNNAARFHRLSRPVRKQFWPNDQSPWYAAADRTELRAGRKLRCLGWSGSRGTQAIGLRQVVDQWRDHLVRDGRPKGDPHLCDLCSPKRSWLLGRLDRDVVERVTNRAKGGGEIGTRSRLKCRRVCW